MRISGIKKPKLYGNSNFTATAALAITAISPRSSSGASNPPFSTFTVIWKAPLMDKAAHCATYNKYVSILNVLDDRVLQPGGA